MVKLSGLVELTFYDMKFIFLLTYTHMHEHRLFKHCQEVRDITEIQNKPRMTRNKEEDENEIKEEKKQTY
jgi:hypothetical protein